MKGFVNIGRTGAFNGLFGNPVHEKKVSSQYRTHFRKVMRDYPKEIEWLRAQLLDGKVMFCPGCGVGSATCHGRVIEDELENPMNDPCF